MQRTSFATLLLSVAVSVLLWQNCAPGFDLLSPKSNDSASNGQNGFSVAMTRPGSSKFKVGVFYTPYNKTVLGYDGGRFPAYQTYGIHDYKKKPLNEWPGPGVMMYSELPWLGTFNIEANSIVNPSVPTLSPDAVLKYHAKWLHEMGADFIIWDSSNHAYLEKDKSDESIAMVRDPLVKLLNSWSALRKQGVQTPQVALWVPIPAAQSGTYLIRSLLEVIERPEYSDLIFQHQGKPLLNIVSSDHPEILAQGPANGRHYEPNPALMNELRSRYTIREMWANERSIGSDNWSYLQKCLDSVGGELTPYTNTASKCSQRLSPNPAGSNRVEQIPVTFAYARDHMSNRQSSTPKRRGHTFLRQMETVYDHRNEVEIVTLSWFNTWAAVQVAPLCIPDHPTGLYRCTNQNGRNAYISGVGQPALPRNGGATLGFTDDYDEEFGVAFEPGGVYGDYYMRLVNQALQAISENKNPMDLYDPQTFAVRGELTKLEGTSLRGWACMKGSSNSVEVSLRADGVEFARVRAALDVRNTSPDNATNIQTTCNSSAHYHGFALAMTGTQLERVRGTRVTATVLADSEYFPDGDLSGSILVPNAATPTQTATPAPTPRPVATPTPTPVPPAATPNPSVPAKVVGVIDGVYTQSGLTGVIGWACVTGDSNPIGVHLYVGGPAGAGELVGGYPANQASEPEVAAHCKTTAKAYRYVILLDAETLRRHKGKLIYVHGIGARPGVINDLLDNSAAFLVP